jgi:signal transduction histidine kinase
MKILNMSHDNLTAAGAPTTAGLAAHGPWVPHLMYAKARVFVVEDEEIIREAIGPILEEEGYEVSFAENGLEALRRLASQSPPDIIVLDLRMPVMDGWEFRAIQKDDPKMGLIPVVAISADGSGQAAAISAQAYLRKPVEAKLLLAAVKRVLAEKARQLSAQSDETERLASLGRLAAAVGHEINNPLTFVMLNLDQSMDKLHPSIRALGEPTGVPPSEGSVAEIKSRLLSIADMLQDCRIGTERIRDTVSNLQRLSGRGEAQLATLDVHELIEQSVSMAWNQIRHRARLIRNYQKLPSIPGNGTALGQVFLNLLVNAAQAIPEGRADDNEIKISTRVETGMAGAEVVIEIRDSGAGMAPGILTHVFEPFFTTKSMGQGTGLGLSISRQTIGLHGGRMTVESAPGAGTGFRIFLPVKTSVAPPLPVVVPAPGVGMRRGRILVIDDEPLIGSVIQTALSDEHDVYIAHRGSEAFARLERGEIFDLVLCDIVMPDVSGPAVYATMVKRWPLLVPRLVFMTGGAFTPETLGFVDTVPIQILSKPFTVERLAQLTREYMSEIRPADRVSGISGRTAGAPAEPRGKEA